MKKKLNIILPGVALIATLITFISLVVAWYLSIDVTKDMNFNILQIDSQVTLYQAEDTNFNGVPDLLTSNNASNDTYYNQNANEGAGAFVAYNNIYHTEKYYFNYLSEKYALSEDSSANLFETVTLTNVAPSKVYTFKYEITNYVGLENSLAFAFEANSSIDTTKLKDFDVRLGTVEDTGSVTFTNWTNFCTLSNETYTYSGLSLGSSMTIPGTTGSLSVGRKDLWLQIRANSSATTTITNFTLPQYRITLSFNQSEG